MKIKVVVGLAVALLITLMIFVVGCGDKTTGGGWFYDDCSNTKVTFGFTAIPTDDWDAKGQFQLVEHSRPPKIIHGTFDTSYIELFGYMSSFGGECYVQGDPDPHEFYVLFTDNGEGENMLGPGDIIAVYIDDVELYAGILGGGNVQIHPEEEDD